MIRSIEFTLLFSGFLLALLSCQKEKEAAVPDLPPDTPPDTNVTAGVYAGVYDSTFDYHLFDPPFTITVTWDTLNLYGFGSDSLDLGADGDYDLLLHLAKINPDSIHLLNGMPNPFPYCKLHAQGNLEIATYSESYPIGQGQTGTAVFADRLDHGENIDSIPDWQTGDIKMWGENPGGAGTPPFGDWYYAGSENYLAIRVNGNRFGWIRMDGEDPKNPAIVSYAIRK